MLRASAATSPPSARSTRVEVNSLAAFSGCTMSWLAAAMKRVLSRLALSASALALASSRFSRVSSAVRSSTRRSSIVLAICSASAASTRLVMSAKVITSPPPGMREARASSTAPLSMKRS